MTAPGCPAPVERVQSRSSISGEWVPHPDPGPVGGRLLPHLLLPPPYQGPPRGRLRDAGCPTIEFPSCPWVLPPEGGGH
eukprot:10302347-Heterocapsa_arctica.AAC.1